MKTLHVHDLVIIFLQISWLVLLYHMSQCHAAAVHSSIKCIDHEREALLQFKKAVQDDSYCDQLTSWGKQQDCCQWGGIRCSNLTGNVIMLQIPGNMYCRMGGRIPETLGNLTKLASLDLSGMDLSKATNWVQIINNLPFLRVLYMENCQLSSTIPSPLSYINSSTSLRDVSLYGNYLNHTWIFQWLFNLSRNGNEFVHLDLSDNSLSGTLPSAFGEMYTLSSLSLSFNQLEGLVPDSFLNLTSLRVLDLSDNNFQGLFPFALSNLRSSRALSLSYNYLHGSFSKNLNNNLCNLQKLHLENNNFGDDLSNVIHILSIGCANKPRLEYLDLSMNKFWGSVPNIINTFSSIRELHLNGNYLNGTISQGIGQLSMLEILDVSNSSLKDTLNHKHFLYLSRLRELYLSDNLALVLNISAGRWIPPFQLDIISLTSCNLGPYFPKWLLSQTNFSNLDISNGKISGSIPTTFWTKSLSSNLQSLSMSNNKISGELPNLNLPATFNALKKIDLSSNYLEGAIPLFFEVGFHNAAYIYLNNNKFTEATHLLCPKIINHALEELDQSNNLLSGELPDCFMKLDQLESLHLENNKFSGTIPTSIGALRQLWYLHLENNSFSGELPASLENCTFLIVLDLGYNSLTGYIPSSIGKAFTRLNVLRLRQNKFFGSLPLSFCQLSNLHILDLAMNDIFGIVPKCIRNLTAMTNEAYWYYALFRFDLSHHNEETYIMWKREEETFSESLMQLVKSIDLSGNELQGDIPDGISSLTGLISLDLSRNNFSGEIPSNIGQLTSLDFLDLSNNHLSGEIPISLADVSRLGSLDLSYNNLLGKIPLGTQLRGFSSSSYIGNPLLCGAPLRECAGDKHPTDKPDRKSIIRQDEPGNGDFYLGLCISVAFGFIIGFWGACGSIILKRSWRHIFFRFVDDMKDKFYVMVVVNVARAWRKP